MERHVCQHATQTINLSHLYHLLPQLGSLVLLLVYAMDDLSHSVMLSGLN
jgi:hypothetical protein